MGWLEGVSFEGESRPSIIRLRRLRGAEPIRMDRGGQEEKRGPPPRVVPIFCRFGASRGRDQPVFCFRPWAECK